jgi:hypothetical protein
MAESTKRRDFLKGLGVAAIGAGTLASTRASAAHIVQPALAGAPAAAATPAAGAAGASELTPLSNPAPDSVAAAVAHTQPAPNHAKKLVAEPLSPVLVEGSANIETMALQGGQLVLRGGGHIEIGKLTKA